MACSHFLLVWGGFDAAMGLLWLLLEVTYLTQHSMLDVGLALNFSRCYRWSVKLNCLDQQPRICGLGGDSQGIGPPEYIASRGGEDRTTQKEMLGARLAASDERSVEQSDPSRVWLLNLKSVPQTIGHRQPQVRLFAQSMATCSGHFSISYLLVFRDVPSISRL